MKPAIAPNAFPPDTGTDQHHMTWGSEDIRVSNALGAMAGFTANKLHQEAKS